MGRGAAGDATAQRSGGMGDVFVLTVSSCADTMLLA